MCVQLVVVCIQLVVVCKVGRLYIVDLSMAYDYLSAANSCSHISSDLL